MDACINCMDFAENALFASFGDFADDKLLDFPRQRKYDCMYKQNVVCRALYTTIMKALPSLAKGLYGQLQIQQDDWLVTDWSTSGR